MRGKWTIVLAVAAPLIGVGLGLLYGREILEWMLRPPVQAGPHELTEDEKALVKLDARERRGRYVDFVRNCPEYDQTTGMACYVVDFDPSDKSGANLRMAYYPYMHYKWGKKPLMSDGLPSKVWVMKRSLVLASNPHPNGQFLSSLMVKLVDDGYKPFGDERDASAQ